MLEDVFADARPNGQNPIPPDQDLAAHVVLAMQQFENAINAATSAGLIVETHLERVGGRLKGVAESYVAKVEMYREAQ